MADFIGNQPSNRGNAVPVKLAHCIGQRIVEAAYVE